jgi:hypothetical protein
MAYQTIETIERRRRIVRIALFLVILGTMPFYCAGFLLWGTAGPVGVNSRATLATNTPIGSNITPSVTRQPTQIFSITVTLPSQLQPTPLQFNPGLGSGSGSGSTGGGAVLPPVIPPTVFIPTSTLAPTLTPFPTNPPPPTVTPTPLPTDPPLPTNPPPTDAPPPTDEPPPTVEEIAPPVVDAGAEEMELP